METFSALLAICAGNSPVAGEILAQRPVTRSFDVFFDLGLNERLRKLVTVMVKECSNIFSRLNHGCQWLIDARDQSFARYDLSGKANILLPAL